MDPLTITAASGLRARMESLDMLANNIANSETCGYKTDREFYNIYTSAEATGADGEDPSALPVIEKNYTDFSAGVVRPTSNPLDFAIQGKGFFTVNSPSGVAYTRNGSFQISAAGTLVTADGNAVLDSAGKTIALDPSVPVSVGADGTITQSGTTAAQISLVDLDVARTLVSAAPRLISAPLCRTCFSLSSRAQLDLQEGISPASCPPALKRRSPRNSSRIEKAA
jgi:flagellar basal-body rod protein FlgF